MASFPNIRANRVNAQTIASNFYQGSSADITNIACSSLYTDTLTAGSSVLTGNVVINSTTQSTNPYTGALVVAGGVGVGGNLNIGDNLGVSGSAYVGDNFTVGGSAYIEDNLGVSGSVYIGNYLGVSGSVGITGSVNMYGILNVADTINGAYCYFNNITQNYIINDAISNQIIHSENNTGFGYQTLSSMTIGDNNNAFGGYALNANTSGYDNVAIGNKALQFNTNGHYNNAFGTYALQYNTTGISNTALGHQALWKNSTGSYNEAIGLSSLASNISGSNNIAFGNSSLYNLTGTNNVGDPAGYNVCIGDYSGEGITGSFNTCIGYLAGQYSTNSNNTFLGSNTGFSSAGNTGQYVVCIGANATPSSDGITGGEITLGDTNISALRCEVTSITALSDIRDKADVEILQPGIDLINQIQPSRFRWDRRSWYADGVSDGSKKADNWTAGFIAQQLDQVQTENDVQYLNLVYKSNPEKIEATPVNLFPVVVKALQDLSKKNDILQEQNNKLTEQLAILELRVTNLENK